MLQKTCRDFADNELVPNAAKYDRDHQFPADKISLMGKLGLMGINVPEELGEHFKTISIYIFSIRLYIRKVVLVWTIRPMPLLLKKSHEVVPRAES